jgi:hypothetical protein
VLFSAVIWRILCKHSRIIPSSSHCEYTAIPKRAGLSGVLLANRDRISEITLSIAIMSEFNIDVLCVIKFIRQAFSRGARLKKY